MLLLNTRCKIKESKNNKTSLTPFVKAKLKNNQTNIDKYSVAANITDYHIISKLILLRIIKFT